MLPSGNDAAVTLAENFGELMIKKRLNKNSNRLKLATPGHDRPREVKQSEIVAETLAMHVGIFVKEMNRYVNVFHLKSTKFSNPHGLADKGNRSTAFDIAVLAFHALKDPNFRSIVNKQ